MATVTKRRIVKIDPEKCNGCGLCVPSCAEGAIQIVDGKARLAAENLCDGLGACLGECPQGAISIEDREAEEFDECAVEANRPRTEASPELNEPAKAPAQPETLPCGCPGTMMRMLKQPPAQTAGATGTGIPLNVAVESVHETCPPKGAESRLSHWPVQLALLPVKGPMWQDANVLIAADCVAFALADFHERLLAGRSLAIACPKLDDVGPYVDKLAAIFAGNAVKSITVAHMEVPCCGGIVRAVHAAMERSGRTDIPVRDVTVGINGTILCER
jgi:NAD-dependent dihydropyrimidine dehydrogenase PreA subunit